MTDTDHPGRSGDSRRCMRRVRVTGRGDSPGFIRMGDDLLVEIDFDSPETLSDLYCRAYVKNSLNTPVFGLGGVTPGHVGEVTGAGASGVAVIGAILGAERPADAVKAFLDALGRA